MGQAYTHRSTSAQAGTPDELRRPAPHYSGGPAGKPRKTFEGTPEYVAPELLQAYDAAPARNAAADPMRAAATFASDVYSLAVLANEVASGKAPYEGAERPGCLMRVSPVARRLLAKA